MSPQISTILSILFLMLGTASVWTRKGKGDRLLFPQSFSGAPLFAHCRF